MVDAITLTKGVTATPTPTVKPSVVASANTALSTSSSSSKSSSGIGTITHTYTDALSGTLIIAQTDDNQNVVYQTPPGLALTYLRNGLTEDGQSKKVLTA